MTRALEERANVSASDLPVETLSLSLQDLTGYFQSPEDDLDPEMKQSRVRLLRSRQDLFQEEVTAAAHHCVFSRTGRKGLLAPNQFEVKQCVSSTSLRLVGTLLLH